MHSDNETPIRRRRTGCLTCRRRKKRCDEGKPECRTCVRLGYVCEGYPKPVRYEARSTTATPAPPARTPAVSQSQRPTIELQGDISWADETIVPYRTNIENQGAPTDTWLGLDDVPTADYFQLDWDALNSSLTEAEMEHMLSTPKSDGLPRAVAVPEEQYQMHKAQPPSSIPQSLPNLIDGLESPIRRQLFTHFTKVTSLVLTTSSGEENPFLTTVVPRSLHDSMIREAILCVAASHLTNLTGKVDLVVTSEKKTTLETAETEQVARLAALKKPVALQKESDREAILISALLLCLYEISEGTGDVCWRIRLDTARSLVQSTDSRNTSNPSISQFSLEYYMYHDVLARATDPFQQTIFEPSSDTISPSMHTSNSHMIGVYDGLLRMVAKVSALQNKVTEVGRIDGMLICEAMDLWTELERWQPKISSTEDPRQLRLVCSAYVSALSVWLYAIVHPASLTDAKVQGVVRDGLTYLQQISYTSSMAVLLFPTFVLGFACVKREERDEILSHFQTLIKFSAMGNVRLARDVLQRWWSDYDSGKTEQWNWKQQMDLYGISLPLT